MMDGRRDAERPRGAVLGPLALLLAAAATGYGMWRALMRNSLESAAPVAHVVSHVVPQVVSDDRLVQDTPR